MKELEFKFIIIVSMLFRFFVCLTIMSPALAMIYSIGFTLFYYFARKYNVIYIIMILMLDYIFMFNLTGNYMGINIYSLLISVFAFAVMNSILYIALVNKVGEETSSKALTKKSNVYVDKGLKALEENKVDDAVNEFKSAIKSYKKNYLGYMGMCDALSKSEKKNLIKMKYYKKKCIKYAPKELKDNIVRRYE